MSNFYDINMLKRVAKHRENIKGYNKMNEKELRKKIGIIIKSELLEIDSKMKIGNVLVKNISADAIKRGRYRTYEEWRNKW